MENLEKKIKDKLQHNEINIDTNELWNEVYPRIKPKRNKKVMFFILTGLLWVTSLFIVGYYCKSDKTKVVELNVIADNEEMNIASSPVTTQEVSESEKHFDLKSAKDKEYNTENITSEESLSSKSEMINDVNRDSGLSTTSNRSVLQPKKRNHVGNENTRPKKTISQGFVKQLDKVKTSQPDKKIIPEDLGSDIKDEKSDLQTIQSRVVSESDINDIDRSINNWPATLTNNAIPSLKFEYPQPNIPNDFYAAHVESASFSKLSVYLRGGISSISRSLSAKENIATVDLQQRINAESPLESVSGELGISYQLRPNLLISAGINYNRINEQIQDSYSVTDTVLLENVIIENIISSRGSEPVFGNIESARTVSTNLTAYNRYSDIALSLDLTYLLRTQGVKPYVTAGMQQSISSSQSGYWLINDNDLYDLSQDPNSYLSRSYGLGLRLGVGVDLDLSDRSSLRIGGKYTKYLNSITSEAYSLKQKYNLLGLSAGLNIKI